jgi:Xaa-Pro aminopeptidase
MIEADFVLEPGMVVSVDHPYTMLGWGTTHLEDLSVITEHGAEPLNVHSEALIVI